MGDIELGPTEDHVRVLRFNRPARRNALTFELVADLHDALDTVAGDASCKVLVVTGEGDGFCAGLDLRDFGTPPGPGEHRHSPVNTGGQAFMANITQHLRATPQVVIAAVNGAAYGGGLALAAACDIRIAAERATFCSAFIRTGLTGTDIGISYLLPRLIGASRAFDLILTGRTINAAEAERIGLASRVVPDGVLMEEAMATAATLAGYTQIGLTLTKEVLWHNVDNPSMAAAIALENRNQMLAVASPEVRTYMAEYSRRVAGG